MANDSDVPRAAFVSVLKAHRRLLSDQDGLLTLSDGADATEIIIVPDGTHADVSRRMVRRVSRKYHVPIHHFYNPGEAKKRVRTKPKP